MKKVQSFICAASVGIFNLVYYFVHFLNTKTNYFLLYSHAISDL